MSKDKFGTTEKDLIENFIKKANKECIKKKISFKYDLHDTIYVDQKFVCPRGNAAADKWSDRVLSDTFYVTDMICYAIEKNNKKIGSVYFVKYVSSKLVGADIVTINVTQTIEPYFHIYEYYPGIGVRFLKNMISSKGIDYSGFKTKVTYKDIVKSEYEDYKSRIGRGREDVAEFFDDKRKHLIKFIK